MGKIRLANNQELNIVADGIMETGNILYILAAAELPIEQFDTLFSEKKNVEKIWVIDYTGELFQGYTGFVNLKSVTKEYDAVVSYTDGIDAKKEPVKGTAIRICLERPDETQQRITALEETVDTLVMESLERQVM